jgi:hypothetical protein
MTDHTIPPRELVEQWASEKCYDERDWLYELHIANRAAQWGADQELEACCEWLDRNNQWAKVDLDELRDGRRPKPLSLKEQALALLDKAEDPSWDINDFSIVRKALEQLND